VAEQLFMERGYTSVRLKDIAQGLDIKTASLYYHAPGGKEDLFTMVLERNLERHERGMKEAIESGGGDVEAELIAASSWILSQPPMHLMRMMQSDMPVLSDDTRAFVERRMFAAIFQPFMLIFARAAQRGEMRDIRPDLLTGSWLSVLEGIRYAGADLDVQQSNEGMMRDMVSVFMRGVLGPASSVEA